MEQVGRGVCHEGLQHQSSQPCKKSTDFSGGHAEFATFNDSAAVEWTWQVEAFYVLTTSSMQRSTSWSGLKYGHKAKQNGLGDFQKWREVVNLEEGNFINESQLVDFLGAKRRYHGCKEEVSANSEQCEDLQQITLHCHRSVLSSFKLWARMQKIVRRFEVWHSSFIEIEKMANCTVVGGMHRLAAARMTNVVGD